MSKYKTKNNLQYIWNKLDDACGDINNAFELLTEMNLPDNIVKAMETVDFSSIVNLKNEIEELMEGD